MTGVPAGEYGNPALVRRGAMRTAAAQAIEAYSIHGAAPGTAVRLLSGGNAQKLLLARELRGEASVLIAHSPILRGERSPAPSGLLLNYLRQDRR